MWNMHYTWDINPKTISDKDLLEIDQGFFIHLTPFITRGYRIPNGSWSKTLMTIFHIHNETINIWTHLLGFLYFIYLLLENIIYSGSERDPFEILATNLYLTTVSSVLYHSTLYHTSISHSVPVANRCLCNDWQSVALLAGSSSIFNGYFELYRHGYQWEYFIFVILNSFTTYKVAKMCVKSVKECSHHTSVCKDLQQDQKERELSILQRTILSVSLALSCYLTWLLHWWKRGELTDDMIHTIIGMSISYLFYGSFILKVTSIPERFFPNSLDIFGQSHQIFHIGSFIGAYAGWMAYRPFMNIDVSNS